MSGLALSSLLLLCLVIPGFVFQYRYYRGAASSWKTSSTIDTNVPRALLLAVLFCVPAHTLWTSAINLSAPYTYLGAINYSDLFALMQGNALTADSLLFEQLETSLAWKFSAYILTQTAAAYLMGNWIAIKADDIGWSKKVALSSPSGLWHRLLRYPEDNPDGIIVSLTVTLGGTTYLYYGLLSEYFADPDSGKLTRVVLEGAVRVKIGPPKKGEKPYDIPGEYFIVECDRVETVDIDYFWINGPGVREDSAETDTELKAQVEETDNRIKLSTRISNVIGKIYKTLAAFLSRLGS